MNGLVSSPAPAPDPGDAVVVADDWFPPVTLASVREAVRLGDGAVTTARLTAAIEGAMLHAFRELADWRTARALEGAAKLADVTQDTLNGENRAELLWTRVIRYFAAAEVVNSNRDISATDNGLDRAMEKDTSADEYRRLALAAVADLRSIGADTATGPNRVELI